MQGIEDNARLPTGAEQEFLADYDDAKWMSDRIHTINAEILRREGMMSLLPHLDFGREIACLREQRKELINMLRDAYPLRQLPLRERIRLVLRWKLTPFEEFILDSLDFGLLEES